jgi:hypothetical protein
MKIIRLPYCISEVKGIIEQVEEGGENNVPHSFLKGRAKLCRR